MNKLLSLIFAFFFLCLPVYSITQDFIVDEFLKDKEIQKPFTNMTSTAAKTTTAIPIYLSISNKIKSEKDLYEGEIIKFAVEEDVKYNGKTIIKRGTIVSSRVETVIKNGMNGIPASVILGDFKVPNISPKNLTFYYEKYGRDLSLLVYPLKWLLTPLYPSGSLTNFIKGGHVKITPNTNVTIYYYP